MIDRVDDEMHLKTIAVNAGKTLGVAALILFCLWALTSTTTKRFFVEWGGQTVEVTPIEAPDGGDYGAISEQREDAIDAAREAESASGN